MTQFEFEKRLQNLKSWKQFAMNGVVQNIPEANKIEREIIELKDEFYGRSLARIDFFAIFALHINAELSYL